MTLQNHTITPQPSRSFALSSISVLLLAAGCAVGPNYKRPIVSAQTGWKETNPVTNTAVLPPTWWTVFEDAELDSLEATAVEANQDLKRAIARVTEARATTRATKAELYPSLSASSAYSRNHLSENRANSKFIDRDYDDFSGSFDFSYELDVWGRIRRSVEASKADSGAIAADQQVVLLSLSADVARNYFQLRSLDNERRVIEATIELRKDAVNLQETRNRSGLINEVDVTRARTELANVEADLQTVIRSRTQTEHALAILCGQPPANFSVAPRQAEIPVPEIPAGLPSSLLERRPDIVEAEQNLEAASARIGVAKAAFFPTIKLTSTAGLASADLGTVFDWPSRVGSVGPSIHVPIFEGGKNRAELDAARARYEQVTASYRGTILNAFREVEDSLSDLTTLASQNQAVNRALASSRDTAALANERYQRGLSSYLDVVDAQRAVLQAERQETQLRGQRAVSTILLAKAIGGGWENSR